MFAFHPKEQRRQGKSALGPPCIVYSQEVVAAAAEISEPLLSAYLEAQLRLPVTWYSHKESNTGLWSIFLAGIYSEVTHRVPVETGDNFCLGIVQICQHNAVSQNKSGKQLYRWFL